MLVSTFWSIFCFPVIILSQSKGLRPFSPRSFSKDKRLILCTPVPIVSWEGQVVSGLPWADTKHGLVSLWLAFSYDHCFSFQNISFTFLSSFYSLWSTGGRGNKWPNKPFHYDLCAWGWDLCSGSLWVFTSLCFFTLIISPKVWCGVAFLPCWLLV